MRLAAEPSLQLTTLLLETQSLELTGCPGWPMSPRDPLVPASPDWGYRCISRHPAYVWVMGPELKTLVHVASTLLTEASPQPCICVCLGLWSGTEADSGSCHLLDMGPWWLFVSTCRLGQVHLQGCCGFPHLRSHSGCPTHHFRARCPDSWPWDLHIVPGSCNFSSHLHLS